MNLLELNIAREVCARERKKVLDGAGTYLDEDEKEKRKQLYDKQLLIEEKMLKIVLNITN